MDITDNLSRKVDEDPFDNAPKKILLIEPPFYNFFGYQRWYYPITLTLVGTFLKEKGHEVKIYDADKPKAYCSPYSRTQARENYHRYFNALRNPNEIIWEEIRKEISNFNPDVIGITSVTAKIDSANRIAQISREVLGKRAKIILGGSHAQGMIDSYQNYDFGKDYDFIITHLPNLVDRKPDKSLLSEFGTYSPRDMCTILTSTGCPNSCTYCCNSLSNRKMCFRNLKTVEEELFDIKKWFGGSEVVSIEDDCFFSYTGRFHEIGKLFREMGLKFSGNSRVNDLSTEKIEEFMKNGGARIYVGIESGSQKVLDRVKKRSNLGDIIRKTALINDFNLPWSAFFMVGFPFETLDDLKLTEELIYKVQPTFVSINRFTPYPGTELWKEYYLDSNLDFKYLFQLNPDNRAVKLSNEIEEYLSLMFERFDDYNRDESRLS